MAYQKTTWVDHIVDPVTGDVVQQGTKVTATRMNKMEQGIADAQVLTEALAQTVIGSPVVSGLGFSSSGLTAQWTAGVAYVNGVRFEVNAGSIKLNATQGQYIYLDSDGVVKNTTTQATADAKCKLWYFATDASSIITSIDGRNMASKEVFVKQTEVAANGANKIPRLDGTGKGAFSITGEAGGTQVKLDAHASAADPHTQYAKKVDNNTFQGNQVIKGDLFVRAADNDKQELTLVFDEATDKGFITSVEQNVGYKPVVIRASELLVSNSDGSGENVALHAGNMNALLGNKNALFNSSAALDLIGWKDVTNHGNFFAGEGGYGEVNFFGHYSNTSTLYESLDSTPIRLAPTALTTLSGEAYTVGLIGANALAELHYMDSNLNTLKQEQVLIPSGKHWEFFSITSVAPANTAYCKVRLALPPNSTNTNTAWRKLKLENGSRATPYDNSADITHINKRIGDYNVFKSGKDSNGVYTVVDYKQRNGALVMKSTLSNPDSSGNYQTLTKKYYSLSGFNYYTEVWTFTYDADGQILSQVVKND